MIESALINNAGSYFDLNSLGNLKNLSKNDPKQGLQEVSKQFEAVFLQMVLKNMRQANEAFESDLFKSHAMSMYRDMFDQQIALNMSEQGSTGLAKVLNDQFSPKAESEKAANANIQATGLQLGSNSFFPLRGYDRKDFALSPQYRVMQEAKQHPLPIAQPATTLQNVSDSLDPQKFDSPEHFVEHLLPYAKQVANQLKMDPKMLIAQAALETGWGKSMINNKSGENSFNLFGIKANKNWHGPATTTKTHEFIDGESKLQTEPFRQYRSYAESFSDYADFISQPRYQSALQVASNPDQFFKEIQKSGYATDPNYADKMSRIYWSPTLQQLSI